MKRLGAGILLLCVSVAVSAAEPRLSLDLGAGTSIDLLYIPAGEFVQGSPPDEAGRGADELQRKVRLTRDFYISRTAITRGQWARFAAETGHRTEAETGKSGGYGWDGKALVQRKEFTWKSPGFQQSDDHPVCLVTFPDAEAFCRWIEKKSRRKTSLPTEAQWEYACRAGSTTPWHSGTTSDAWHKGNSGNSTHPVDSNTPNPWDLVMGGNVSEWCLDWYGPYEASLQIDPRQGNPNLSDKPRRVLRGGSWLRDAKNTRSAARYRVDPRSRNADIGFRIVCAADVISPIVEMPIGAATSPKPEVIPSPLEIHENPAPVNLQPAPLKTGISWLLGLPCLLIPIGLVIVLVRFVARGRSSSSPFVSTGVPQPPRPVLTQAIRKVADGFWIHSHDPAGTVIHLLYVIQGQTVKQDLIYQPGPEGQFVYTGIAPESVTITGSGDQPPPLSQRPPPMREREDPRETDTIPPRFPPAY